jgi:hypothetical protein
MIEYRFVKENVCGNMKILIAACCLAGFMPGLWQSVLTALF